VAWSPAAFCVWGKSDQESNSWLPLVTHLEHSAAMAGHLWDGYLPRAVKELLTAELQLPDPDVRAIACWFAGIHDVGKCSNVFARQVTLTMPSLLGPMRSEGMVTSSSSPEQLRHEVISQQALAEWLVEVHGAIRRTANTWACVVGGHHGRNPTTSTLGRATNSPDLVGRGRWAEVRREILDGMADRTGVAPRLSEWVGRRLSVPAQALLTGIVVVADWMASNQDYFPYHDNLTPDERAAVAFAELSLPEPWTPPVPTRRADEFLHARFPALGAVAARPVQAALVEASFACESAPLLIVEAAMGVGKTEAALLASEVLASRFGQGGVFLGLPTMATANPMFGRVLAWLETCLGAFDASVSLAHGKAGLNDRYAGLIRESFRGHVYDEDADSDAGSPVVNGWLRGRKKAGLASFVVGTVDQGLFGALKAKHVVLRHLGLAGKVVVIDEVHAADTYMREYLKRVLTWLGAYRTPVILMSATLPPNQRDEYVAAYAWGRGDREPTTTDRGDSYPRITCYDGVVSDVPVVPEVVQTSVRLERLPDDPVATLELLRELLADGGCAGVICNTVGRAQELFGLVRAEFGSDAVLLHSRFIAPDRAAREARLVTQLGPTGERPHRMVIVGTQVLEQSLDVDFDVMVTDLAPLDLVLQRMGRLHRHARSGRPDALADPILFLRGVEDWTAAPPLAVPGAGTIYGGATLLRAAAVLEGRASVSLPIEIPILVRTAYDPGLAAPHGWEARWAEAEQWSVTLAQRARGRARAYLLDDPAKPVTLDGWIDVNADDPDRSEEQGRSQVRDSEDSLEVIALWRDAAGNLVLPHCAPKHPGAPVPQGIEWGTGSEQSVARDMASCTLSLPLQLTNERVIDSVIRALERTVDYSGWQKSPWITGQLVVAFDPDNRAQIADFELRYSPDEGLIVTHPEEHK